MLKRFDGSRYKQGLFLGKLRTNVYTMGIIKKWISCIVVLAFVVTTIPSISHAAMSHDSGNFAVKSEQTSALTHEGCAGHDGQKQDVQKTVEKKDISEKSCCDGKTCKCIGSSCNGSVKVFGSNNFGFTSPRSVKALFSIEERTADSDFYSRIKRPPRA